MTFSQADIGFDVNLKHWFLQFWSATRWMINTLSISNEVKLDEVQIDTYQWADQNNEKDSHGRFRFYQSTNKIDGTVKDEFPEDITIHGNKSKIEFTHHKAIPTIWYNRSDMEWNVSLNGTKYSTKHVIGTVSGILTKDPIRFVAAKEVDVFYSGMVTLIDVKPPTLKKD